MCGQGQLNYRQMVALGHPIRFRIVELFATEAARSLAVADLTATLEEEFPRVTLAQVNYHLRHLQLVELIPLATD